MGKLHQNLAVEDSLLTRFKAVIEEGTTVFSKQENLFKGLSTKQTSKLNPEDAKYAEFPDATETVPVASTVNEKLEYIFDVSTKYFDATAQRDEANCRAVADLIINDTVILAQVPATTLLFIENKFKTIRGLLTSIKTLDQAKVWSPSPIRPGVMQATEVTKPVKEAVEEWRIVVAATDKHPAQTQKMTEHHIRAIKATTELSGLISSAQLSKLLKRCDEIINAAKTARQTANDTEVKDVHVGKKLFNYLMS